MKSVGIINIVLSGIHILLNIVGFFVLYIQKAIIERVESPFEDFTPVGLENGIEDVYNVAFLSIPASTIAYVVLLWSGIKILQQNEIGFRFSRIAAYTIIGLYLLYTSYMYTVLSPLVETMSGGIPLFGVIYFAAALLGGIFACGYPVFLLFFLSSKRYEKNYPKTEPR
jgi:hypothetical protein